MAKNDAGRQTDEGGRQHRTRSGWFGRPFGSLVRRREPEVEVIPGYAGDPFAVMRGMVEDLNRMMDELWSAPSLLATRGDWGGFADTWLPEIEVRRTDGALVVTADLPGLRREDIDIELVDGALRIAGERTLEQKDEREGVLRSERRYGRFERVVPLPDGVDEDKVTARFADGVLEVTVPLTAEAARSRKIAVE